MIQRRNVTNKLRDVTILKIFVCLLSKTRIKKEKKGRVRKNQKINTKPNEKIQETFTENKNFISDNKY